MIFFLGEENLDEDRIENKKKNNVEFGKRMRKKKKMMNSRKNLNCNAYRLKSLKKFKKSSESPKARRI